MRLLSFQVFNFRSVNDSGKIEVRDRTALVGRNESGKTNLLLALQSLNPADGFKELSYVKDFPRDRHKNEFSKDLKVVETWWQLSEDEKKELTTIFPRAKGISEVHIGRWYKEDSRLVGLIGLPPIEFNAKETKRIVSKLDELVRSNLNERADDPKQKPALKTLDVLLTSVPLQASDVKKWGDETLAAVKQFQEQMLAVSYTLPAKAIEIVEELKSLASEKVIDDSNHTKARKWILDRLPKFVYLHEYPELEGHQSIPQYISSVKGGAPNIADVNFTKLCKVAGLDPMELNKLLQEDHETRQQLVNRAGAVVTKKLRELWTDRALTIRFNVDADHFDTLVSDPTSYYPVEINLDERSRGFKWFFSFYISFSADTTGGPAENAIILLDEPGLYLHAIAQRNLLNHFAKDFKNTIIYTTHSPFMIPVDDLASIRTLNISQDKGTTVTNDPTGDDKTLFPIQAALGYDISQSLFIGKHNLVVEGVSDYWYLSCISEFLQEDSRNGLPEDLVITPAGGAPKVTYMVSLLTSQRLNVLVLLDSEQQGKLAKENLVKSKLLKEQNVVLVNEAYDGAGASEADIEDLIDSSQYDSLVKESYAKELKGKPISLNIKIPRIVKRYEEAFEKVGVTFNKMRPAKLFLRKIVDKPDEVLSKDSKKVFGTLFSIISERLKKAQKGSSDPIY